MLKNQDSELEYKQVGFRLIKQMTFSEPWHGFWRMCRKSADHVIGVGGRKSEAISRSGYQVVRNGERQFTVLPDWRVSYRISIHSRR